MVAQGIVYLSGALAGPILVGQLMDRVKTLPFAPCFRCLPSLKLCLALLVHQFSLLGGAAFGAAMGCTTSFP